MKSKSKKQIKVTDTAVYNAVQRGENYSFTFGRYLRRNGISVLDVRNIVNASGIVSKFDYSSMQDGWNTEDNIMSMTME